MTDSIYDWSTTASSNANADSSVNWAEFQDPDTVNNSARAMMARHAEYLKDVAALRASTGAANTYAVTSNSSPAALRDGFTIAFRAHQTNTAASTLAVNSYGAKALRSRSGTALLYSEILSGAVVIAQYVSATDEFLLTSSPNLYLQTLGPSLFSSSTFGLKVGDVKLSLATSPDAGFVRLKETAQALNKADYPDLNTWASAQGYPWGSASTTFNVPPAGGYFLRFGSQDSTIDPSGPRTGGVTQTDQNKAHTHTGTTGAGGAHAHTFKVGSSNIGSGGGGTQAVAPGDITTAGSGTTVTTATESSHTHSFTTASDGGTEARPKNVTMYADMLAVPALVASGLVGASGLAYTFSSSTAAADPGAGKISFNNATLGSATVMYVSETDANGAGIAGILAAISANSTVYMTKVGSPANLIAATVSSTGADLGAYRSFTLSSVTSAGTISNGDSLSLIILGAAGAAGTTVPDISGLTVLPYASRSFSDKKIVYDVSALAHKAVYDSPVAIPLEDPQFGAIGDNTTDNSTGIQLAIDYAASIGGADLIISTPGTYKFTSSLTLKDKVVLRLSQGVTLRYTGAGASIQSSTTECLQWAGIVGGTLDYDGTYGLDLRSPYQCFFKDIELIGSSATGIAINVESNSSGDTNDDGNRNSVFNYFENILENGTCGTVLRLRGIGTTGVSATAPVTLNTFTNLQARDVRVRGVDIAEWADSNKWIGCSRYSLTANSAVGVEHNTAHPTQNCGVYANIFDYLAVDTFGSLTGRVAVKMNYTKQNYIHAFQNYPYAEGGSLVTTADTGTYEVHFVDESSGQTWVQSNAWHLRNTSNMTFGSSGQGVLTSTGGVAVPNTGLQVADTDASHFLSVKPASNLTANRSLNIATGDADRNVTFGADFNVGAGGTLGTAAWKNTGTSGNNVPLLDGANTFSAALTVAVTTQYPTTFSSTLGGNVQNTYKNLKATGAAGDSLDLAYNFNNSAGAEYQGGLIRFNQDTATASSETTSFTYYTKTAGAGVAAQMILANGVKFPSVGTTASAANAYLDNGASNNLLRSTSSIRYKTDVELLSSRYAAAIRQLRPVWYRSTADADRKDWGWYGLIAEEVAAVDPRLVHWAYADDDMEEIRTDLPPIRSETPNPPIEDDDGDLIEQPPTVILTPQPPIISRRPKAGAQKKPDGVQYERLAVLLLADMATTRSKVADALSGIDPATSTLPDIARALVSLREALA